MSYHQSRFVLTLALLSLSFTTTTVARASGEDKPQPNPDTPAQEGAETPGGRLAMSAAVACRSIEGYENYEVLPTATLTADEKLLVYYRPLHFAVETREGKQRIHLTQDGQIRRRGQKQVLLSKVKLLEYDIESARPLDSVYLRNTISLKGLKPGDYEFDIILHDKLAKSEPVKQTLLFRVVTPSLHKKGGDAEPAANRPSSAAKKGTKH